MYRATLATILASLLFVAASAAEAPPAMRAVIATRNAEGGSHEVLARKMTKEEIDAETEKENQERKKRAATQPATQPATPGETQWTEGEYPAPDFMTLWSWKVCPSAKQEPMTLATIAEGEWLGCGGIFAPRAVALFGKDAVLARVIWSSMVSLSVIPFDGRVEEMTEQSHVELIRNDDSCGFPQFRFRGVSLRDGVFVNVLTDKAKRRFVLKRVDGKLEAKEMPYEPLAIPALRKGEELVRKIGEEDGGPILVAREPGKNSDTFVYRVRSALEDGKETDFWQAEFPKPQAGDPPRIVAAAWTRARGLAVVYRHGDRLWLETWCGQRRNPDEEVAWVLADEKDEYGKTEIGFGPVSNARIESSIWGDVVIRLERAAEGETERRERVLRMGDDGKVVRDLNYERPFQKKTVPMWTAPARPQLVLTAK